MGVYAITGATTGIGAATKKILQDQGHEVINIDIVDGDITADLAIKTERERAMKQLFQMVPSGLDCFIACAGVGPTEPGERITSLNYFAQKEMTEAAFPLLEMKKGTALVVSSNSANFPGLNYQLVDLMCNENSEEKVTEFAKALLGPARYVAYQASKFAIGRWTRRISGSWAARGIRINAIAPGATMTPLMQAGLDSEDFSTAMANVPVPICYSEDRTYLTAEEVAKVMVFLTGPDSSAMAGAVIYADGACDGMMRTERF